MRVTHRFLLLFVLLPLVVATVVSGVILWPEHHKYPGSAANLAAGVQLVNANAASVTNGPCQGDPSQNVCQTLVAHLTSGPEKGADIQLVNQNGPGQVVIQTGDKLVLGRSPDDAGGPATYYFSDFQRKVPLFWMSIAFAILVTLIARWRGIGALFGLLFTFFAVTYFVLPSILAGHSPVLVAITGSAAIVLVVLYIAHGFNVRSTIALVGTLFSLILTGVLAWFAVRVTHLTGLSSEEATSVQTFAGQVNLQGLVLGGIVIGSLGVLNDMTVTQASAVWEIHIAQPTRSRLDVYRAGIRIGRDHIASTIYTLVLAYTGAALPLLIIFAIANRRFGDVVGSDVVSEEIVRALIGSIGLMLSVPLTTALAASVLRISRPQDLPATSPEPEAGLDGISGHAVEVYEEAHNSSFTDLEELSPPTAEEAKAEAAEVIEAAPDSPLEPEAVIEKPVAFDTSKAKRSLFRRKAPKFERKMGRRERKFWEN